ncbi:Gfo/Idh/MocA family oxidoreductase, partial [Nitrospira sp. BLG_2]|uniref:Gfo/Idh/MocA family oxidoreductase n=1 Tax=Nitrospira sp. BLG_2 TaxID=3397507 RepID=UPI003B9B9792
MKTVAVVGAGYWGKNLVRNYAEVGALHTICDARLEALAALRKSFPDARYCSQFKDVLADPEVRAVVIALPAESHYEFAAKALRAGKDVFVEKPLALDIDHAKTLNAIALEGKRVLMVGHLLRYHPAFLKLKEMVDRGVLGRLQYVYSTRLSLGKIRREENALWSFAPHDISMILALCNEMPQHVSAVGHNYLHKQLADVTTTHLSFPSGVNGHVFVSWLHPFKEQKLVVIGESKMAVFEDTQPWEKKIALYSHTIKWEGGVPVPEKADPEFVPVEAKEPLREECLHFLRCIENRETPITDGNEGQRVLEVLQRAQQSLEQEPGGGANPHAAKERKAYFVHESAFVDEPCRIGAGTKIWHGAHVMKGAEIG